MTKTLSQFNNDYENILHSELSSSKKSKAYAELMTEMEQEYKIPTLKNEQWEVQNRKVIALYRKISKSREL